MYRGLIIIHLIVSLVMILVVISQSSKGAEMGAVFGGGASQTAFGSQGAGGFLEKVTITCAVIFMVTSLSLAILSSKQQKSLIGDATSVPPIESTVPGAVPVGVPVESQGQSQKPAGTQEGAPASQSVPSPTNSASPVDTTQ